MADLIQQVRERFDVLQKIQDEAQATVQEWGELRDFLSRAEAVRKRFEPASILVPSVPQEPGIPGIANEELAARGIGFEKPGPGAFTSDLARW